MKKELLASRGFRDEEHLNEFLDACIDEAWKAELIEYFGIKPKEKIEEVKEEPKVEEKPKTSKRK